MHVIESDFAHNTLTGTAQGKGKIKLRVDDKQQEILERRFQQTPNIQSKKVEQGNYNKKCE